MTAEGERAVEARKQARAERLIESKARFLAFLERRLGSREDAEDLLQAALLKVVGDDPGLRREDRLIPWFYQVLRNQLADHYRRASAAARLRDRLAADAPVTAEPDEELYRATCACVGDVADTLRPAYAELIRRVELADEPLRHVARELGITANNASVRLHRARQALRDGLRATCGACAEHGCLDCTCRAGTPRPGAGSGPQGKMPSSR